MLLLFTQNDGASQEYILYGTPLLNLKPDEIYIPGLEIAASRVLRGYTHPLCAEYVTGECGLLASIMGYI